MKDPQAWLAELERPPGHTAATAPTERELEQDAQSFMAFASAFGVQPPSRSSPSA